MLTANENGTVTTVSKWQSKKNAVNLGWVNIFPWIPEFDSNFNGLLDDYKFIKIYMDNFSYFDETGNNVINLTIKNKKCSLSFF